MAKPNSKPGISCASKSWMLVASTILMSWSVIRRVTTGASFNVFGEWVAVTTTGSNSIESRIDCAERLIAGIDRAMPAIREYRYLLNNCSVTTYFFVPVNCPSKSNGILPYFNLNVTATVLSLKITTRSFTV